MKTPRYLLDNDYMADPSVHVFNGKIYIYPSHDRDMGILIMIMVTSMICAICMSFHWMMLKTVRLPIMV
jgi:hypothetical protein